jgi:hypothetical protein
MGIADGIFHLPALQIQALRGFCEKQRSALVMSDLWEKLKPGDPV